MSTCDMGELQGLKLLYQFWVTGIWLLNLPVPTRDVGVTVADFDVLKFKGACFL